MKTLNIQQGSQDWLDARLHHYTASEAPAMMGDSPYTTREELLQQKATRQEKEVTEHQQRRYDKGHFTEAKARPLAEDVIGEELYPITASLDVESLPLLASFDGLTLLKTDGFEHKLWNKGKADKIQATEELEPLHYWQLEQQLLVADMNSMLFVMSDGTQDNWVQLRYESQPERRKQLIAGWKQFDQDLQGYQAKDHAEAPEATPVKSLPAITYQLNGLALTSNLDAYKAAAEQLIEDAKKPMETDQDFADGEALVKKFKQAEEKIKLVQEQVVGEIKDVDAFNNDLEFIRESFRQARLTKDKAIKAEKEKIRASIAAENKEVLNDFISNLGQKLPSGIRLSAINVDDNFLAAMKGKKTIKSLNEAASDLLAKAKIQLTEEYKNILACLSVYDELANDYEFLFSDLNVLIAKGKDVVELTIKSRIAEHKAREQEQAAPETPASDSPIAQPEINISGTHTLELSPIDQWADRHDVSEAAYEDLRHVLSEYYGIDSNSLKLLG